MSAPESSISETVPYFDVLFDKIGANRDVADTFGLNVHWGYWSDPETADGSARDFAAAAREMTRRVYAHAGLQNGMRVLDVGCGFGGTIFEINEHFSDMELVGLNIDPRQLERARQCVLPKNGNRITFVEGDACALPFSERPDPGTGIAAGFDAVLAVECIFHFPSRPRFFGEARRVLKPGGRLVISDFVPHGPSLPWFVRAAIPMAETMRKVYGPNKGIMTRSMCRTLGLWSGFRGMTVEDITRNTLPSYVAVERLHQGSTDPNRDDQIAALRFLRTMSERAWLRYLILAFRAGSRA